MVDFVISERTRQQEVLQSERRSAVKLTSFGTSSSLSLSLLSVRSIETLRLLGPAGLRAFPGVRLGLEVGFLPVDEGSLTGLRERGVGSLRTIQGQSAIGEIQRTVVKETYYTNTPSLVSSSPKNCCSGVSDLLRIGVPPIDLSDGKVTTSSFN